MTPLQRNTIMAARKRKQIITLTDAANWKKIVKQVKKEEILVDFLYDLTLVLTDKSTVYMDIAKLFSEGYSTEELDNFVNGEITINNAVLNHIEYTIDATKVSNWITPLTNSFLTKHKI